ncbi:MAG: signal peptidase II [Candidatus Margulisbacteria bacterium]|nr:signal peptidase II [Candidatus Margulisiibacteriota bacterium]
MSDKQVRILPGLFLIVLILDQVTKNIALSTLEFGVSVPVLGDFLRWTLTLNPGGAFSLRLGNPTYYLISSLIIFVILVFFVIRHRTSAYLAVPLSIVAGGAAGNIIDRFRFGEVVDFIDCDFFDMTIGAYHLDRWPIFNVADSAISCGIIATIVLIYFHDRWKKNESNDSVQEELTDKRSE